MLNRRHLRIKALHFLYAAQQGGFADVPRLEKQLISGLEKVQELFLWYSTLLVELHFSAEQEIDRGRNKMLPSSEDLNPNLRFVKNAVLKALSQSPALKKAADKMGVSWAGQGELCKRIFSELKQQQLYTAYMGNEDKRFESERSFVEKIIVEFFPHCEPLQFFLEEKQIVWIDDHEIVLLALQKAVKKMSNASDTEFQIPSLYKDPEDDRKFVLGLFRKTIEDYGSYEQLIAEKAKNWEIDRLAQLDVLLIRMAIAEATGFPSIPVKVTMNEFIELAKQYSTPKSRQFVNGMLDAIFAELTASGAIQKTGRGLVQ